MIKKPRFKIAFIILIMFATIGCAVKSSHNRSYISHSLNQRTGHQLLPEGKKTGAFKLPAGISLTDGLTKDEAIAIAIWNNAKFNAEISKLGFARADLIEAGLLKNPVLSLLFPLGPKQLEATLSLPIDFLWKRPRRIALARLNMRVVAENLIQTGLNLVRDVSIAHSTLILSRNKAEILRQAASLQEEIAKIAQTRLRIGDISSLEETAFRLEAARIRQMAIQASRDAMIAEGHLQLLIGMGVSGKRLKISYSPLPSETPPVLEELLVDAYAARPDLRAAELSLEAAGKQIGLERVNIFKLTAMLDANAEGKEGFESGPGLNLELPIFNQNNGKIIKAKAELERAIQYYLAAKHMIIEAVQQARARYTAAQTVLKGLQDNIVSAAAGAVKNAQEAYNIGEISYLELLTFRRQNLELLLRKAEAEADLRTAEACLEHSIGCKEISDKTFRKSARRR